MHKIYERLSSIFVSIAFLGLLMIAGCYGSVRVYDREHHDYHHWNHGEVVYYNQWEVSTHRDHVDYDKRNQSDQDDYWNWRHKHDHDH